MPLLLYAHPFSSFCQKVLIALYENATPFEWRALSPENPDAFNELSALWPLRKFPLLVDGDYPLMETSIIIEYLQQKHPGPVEFIPRDPALALEVRLLDRIFDLYVSGQQQTFVYNALRPADRDSVGQEQAAQILDRIYRWLDGRLKGRAWAAGEAFSLADCAAAPVLFYAHWTYPIPTSLATLHAYRQRLLARPSFARVVEEARPYRDLFPLAVPATD